MQLDRTLFLSISAERLKNLVTSHKFYVSNLNQVHFQNTKNNLNFQKILLVVIAKGLKCCNILLIACF